MTVEEPRVGQSYPNFYAAQLGGRVAYHDFEGVTTDTAEQPTPDRTPADEYAYFCKSLIESPEMRLQFWLDKK